MLDLSPNNILEACNNKQQVGAVRCGVFFFKVMIVVNHHHPSTYSASTLRCLIRACHALFQVSKPGRSTRASLSHLQSTARLCCECSTRQSVVLTIKSRMYVQYSLLLFCEIKGNNECSRPSRDRQSFFFRFR